MDSTGAKATTTVKTTEKKPAVNDITRSENSSFLSSGERRQHRSRRCMRSRYLKKISYSAMMAYGALLYINTAYTADYGLEYPVLQTVELALLCAFLSEHCIMAKIQGCGYFAQLTILLDLCVLLTCVGCTVGILLTPDQDWLLYLKVVYLLRLLKGFRTFTRSGKPKFFKQIRPSGVLVTTASQDVIAFLTRLLDTTPKSDLTDKLKWCIEVISEDKLHQVKISPSSNASDILPWIQSFSGDQTRRRSIELLQIPLFSEGALGPESVLLVPEAVHECLSLVHRADFDVFQLRTACDGNELLTLVTFLFTKSHLLGFFPGAQVREWALAIQQGYVATNPYHNATHAADVLQTIHSLLFEYRAVETFSLNLLDVACCYLSSAMHDFQHPGRNNKFLVATKHPLAVVYNDVSVLENHHVAAGFALAEKEGLQIFRRLKTNEFTYLRGKIIAMVLATDMSRHFSDLSIFQSYLDTRATNQPHDKTLCMSLLLHCCDISNPAKPWPLCKLWAELISQEFFLQGDDEKAKGLPISDLCDRDKTILEKAQVGFVGVIIQPMFTTLLRVLPSLSELIDTLKQNKEKWRELLEQREQDDVNVAKG